MKTFFKTLGLLCSTFRELHTFYLTVDYRTVELLRLEEGCLSNMPFRAGSTLSSEQVAQGVLPSDLENAWEQTFHKHSGQPLQIPNYPPSENGFLISSQNLTCVSFLMHTVTLFFHFKEKEDLSAVDAYHNGNYMRHLISLEENCRVERSSF